MSEEIPTPVVVAVGHGEAPGFTGLDPATGKAVGRVSVHPRVFEAPARKLALVPNPEPEVDPLVRDGIIAAPTIDPPAAPAAPARRSFNLKSPVEIHGLVSQALTSGSPHRRARAVERLAQYAGEASEVVVALVGQANDARAAFLKLAEYVGPEALADAMATVPVAPAPIDPAPVSE